ncbi:AAA family ATPase [Brucella sp. CMUL 015]|uniref:AAA family ATPase n=1 Tax=Brucella sp. CMUL 015 TaxID=1905697 RepID=UPI0009FB4B58|nr:AAA family ATPase [Brucella sp. CMUL 015]
MTLFDRVITAKDLKEKEDFQNGNEWIVKDIIPRGAGGLVVAPSKSFKSSMTLSMAMSIADGKKWAGHDTRKSNVLIIDNEDTDFTLHQRLNAYNEVPDGLSFVTGGIFKLDNRNHMNGLYKHIIDNDVKVVILDNLKDMLEDENTLNDMSAMNKVLGGITKLKLLLNDVTFILVAHARKAVEEDSLTDKNFRVRSSHALGSSAIGAWFEFCLTMSPKINSKSQNRYSIMRVEARNFAFSDEMLWGYVGDTFLHLDPAKKEKPKLIQDEEEKTGDTFLEVAKQEGKVNEIND